MGFREHGTGQYLAAAKQPAAVLALVGVAGRAPEITVELARQAVRPAGAERGRPVARGPGAVPLDRLDDGRNVALVTGHQHPPAFV